MDDSSPLLYPLHPALGDQVFTHDDCYKIAAYIGVNPQTLAGFLAGRLYPHELFVERLYSFFDKELVDAVLDDYQPERWYVLEKAVRKDHIKQRYPAALLQPGDSVRTDDGRWIRISDVDVGFNFVQTYSGGVKLFRCQKTAMLVVHTYAKQRKYSPERVAEIGDRMGIKEKIAPFLEDENGILERYELFDSIAKAAKDGE